MDNENSNKETMKDTNKKTTKKVSKTKKVDITPFKDLQGRFLHVRVGDNARPATDDDISSIEKQLADLFEENNVECLAFVTHHAVSIDIM